MNLKHVRLEFGKAQNALKAAQILLENSLNEDAVSRSYYAVLHAAKATLLAHSTIAESHASVRRLFGQILVLPGRIEKEWSAILAKEQDQRMIADYETEITWGKETAEDLVENAEAFVQRMQKYLENQGIKIETDGSERGENDKENSK